MRFSEDTPKTEDSEPNTEEKDRIILAPPEPKLRTVGVMGEINEEGGGRNSLRLAFLAKLSGSL